MYNKCIAFIIPLGYNRAMENTVKAPIKVKFIYNVFRNDSNGYSVSKFRDIEEDKAITCKGYNLPDNKSLTYMLNVEEVDDKKYGKQYEVNSFSEYIEESRDGILTYLSSGIIKGIGKKTAEKIFEKYGLDSLDIIENKPEKLLEIKGITKSRLEKIINSYQENHLPKELAELLVGDKFSPRITVAVYKKYKKDAYSMICKNPYVLCDVKGISFAMADSLRDQLSIDIYDRNRISAAIMESIKLNFYSGKVGITMRDLIAYTSKLTGIKDASLIKKSIMSDLTYGNLAYRKIKDNGIVYQYIYSRNIKQAEESLAANISRKLRQKKDLSKKAEEIINTTSFDIVLDDSQKKAVIGAFKHGISIITGGPGTGKTTTIRTISIIDRLIYENDNQIFMAPTGRAARRITESSKIKAKTIHSALNLRPSDNETIEKYQNGDDDKMKDMLVIVDEFSMVDMFLALALFERTENCRFVIVGDPNQLPSVGAGNVLRDMIESGIIPTYNLTYTHRQMEGSTIGKNANLMQNGGESFEEAKDFICDYGKSMKEIEDAIIDTYLKEKEDSPEKSLVVLCPYKKYEAGMNAINKRLQQAINPFGMEFKGVGDVVFRVGDPVMHILTNTDDAVNGDVGTVVYIGQGEEDFCVEVEYPTSDGSFRKQYVAKDINQLTLAYAMTVHKSQGSEYDTAITLLTAAHRNFVTRNIPYTAITRAKKKVYFFSDSKETVRKAIKNNHTEGRNTLLWYLLKTTNETVKKPVAIPKEEKPVKKEQCDGQLSLMLA
jgi:exodeoxyribonuclease V alpha subunit